MPAGNKGETTKRCLLQRSPPKVGSVYDAAQSLPAVFGRHSLSLRLYPHNELSAESIIATLCAQAGLASDVGFDGIMTSEHHGGFAGYMPTPLQVAGFLLHEMRQGWAAACPVLLPLRPVAMLAEEVAWLDARFPQRVGIGVAPGALPLDFDVMECEIDNAVDEFKRRLPQLVNLLRGDDLGQLNGDRALQALSTRPIPVISTAMSKAAVRRAASAGAGVLYDGGTDLQRVAELSAHYLESGGHGPRILIRRLWLGPPPHSAFSAQQDVYRSYSSDAAMSYWRDSGWICRESAEELADDLVKAIKAADATCCNIRLHAPGIEPSAIAEQIEQIGRNVLPLVRSGLE